LVVPILYDRLAGRIISSGIQESSAGPSNKIQLSIDTVTSTASKQLPSEIGSPLTPFSPIDVQDDGVMHPKTFYVVAPEATLTTTPTVKSEVASFVNETEPEKTALSVEECAPVHPGESSKINGADVLAALGIDPTAQHIDIFKFVLVL
jgi:hypothetical protein